MKAVHRDFIEYMARLKGAISRNELSPESVLDACWLMFEIAKYAEDVEKEARKQRELLEKICCGVWVVRCAADPNAPGHLEGAIARGTPKLGLGVNLPEKGSEEYREFLAFLGLSEEQIDRDVVRPHWPHVQDLLTERAEQGLPTPPGIPADRTYPRYKLVALQPKRGVKVD